MSDTEALHALRPATLRDKRALRRFAFFLLLVVIVGAALLYNKNRLTEKREREWITAVATIEDARIHPVGKVESIRGGAMLYEVEVFAKYTADGAAREKWTTVWQTPKLLAEAQLQVFLVKKKQCFIRWQANKPTQIVADID